MQNERIIWRNSTFTRMVITFLLVMVPFYILGMQIFRWSRDMLSKEIFNSMQSHVTFYLNNLSDDIERIQKLQFDCFDDEDLNNLTNAVELMNDYEKSKAITRLQQRLTTIKNSSPYIQNVSVLIPSINRTINAAGSGKGSTEELDESEYEMMENLPLDSKSQILFWNNRLILNAVNPFTYTSTSKPSFVIEVEFSKDALKSALMQSEVDEGVKSILICPSQKFTISSDDNEKTSKEFQELVSKYSEKRKSDTISVVLDGKHYLLIFASSDYLGMTLARYIPESVVFEQLKKYQFWFWAFSILTLIITVFYSFSTYRFIQRPLRKLVKSFEKVENGEFNIQINHSHNDEFKYLYTRFNEMVKSLKELIDQVYKQKILAQKAELKQLQSQINPHFLYNSFFILQRRISKGDYDNAEKFCENLGTYFKFITRSASDEVELAKEVEHARIYAGIQAMRFSNRIKVEFGELPAEYESLIVPRLILQPIIENAFEHGLEDKENDGLLRISFLGSANMVTITIEDNGDMLKISDLEELTEILEWKKENSENTGIINIHKRIRLALGGNSGVRVSRGELGGLKVEIILQTKED